MSRPRHAPRPRSRPTARACGGRGRAPGAGGGAGGGGGGGGPRRGARRRGGEGGGPARQAAGGGGGGGGGGAHAPGPGARAAVTGPKVRDLLERKGDPLQLEA